MKRLATFKAWIGSLLRSHFHVKLDDDALTTIQREAIARNKVASEENYTAARLAAAAIDELLTTMEARKHGRN